MSTKGLKARATKAAYNARPDVMADRVEQNKARRMAEQKGLVHKGDGKNVNHKKMLVNGGKTTPGNLEVTSEKANKGWRKKSPEVYGKNRS